MREFTMALVVLAFGAAPGEPSHECATSSRDATAAQVACEADEIQFGIGCRAGDAKLLAFSTEAIACEADEIQFGFRP